MSLEAQSRSRRQHAALQQLLPSSSLKSSTQREVTSESSFSSSPDPEDRVHSRRAGPDHRRIRSHQRRRALHAPVQARSLHDRRSRRADRPRGRETSPQASPTCSHPHHQDQPQSSPVQPRSCSDRSRRRTSRADRPRGRETPSRTSPRRSRSHQRRRASNPPARPRRRQDRSRRRAPSADRPRDRGTPSGMSHRSSRSRQRRRASTQTSSSST